MMPRKENIHLKPGWLDVPPEPSNTIHLEGWENIGSDQPDLHEHLPDLVREDIRNRYSYLLEQHDSLEIAYWSLEGFTLLSKKDFRFEKYKSLADQLYLEGKLRPNPKHSVLLKHACLCIKDNLPHVDHHRTNDLVDQMVANWLDGSFCPNEKLLEQTIDKIFELKNYLNQFGENSQWAPVPVMNGWVDRLVEFTKRSGSVMVADWDDLEREHEIRP